MLVLYILKKSVDTILGDQEDNTSLEGEMETKS